MSAYKGDVGELLTKLREQFKLWDGATVDERLESLRARDYYDSAQWTKAQQVELKARGQAATVFNLIAPKINYVLGDEIDARIDPKALARNESSAQEADAATDALRFVADKDREDAKHSDVAENVFIEGRGAVVFSIGAGEGDAFPQIETQHIPADRMYWDPFSRKPDFSDARFLGSFSWHSVDDLKTMVAEQLGVHPDEAEAALESTGAALDTMLSVEDDRPIFYDNEPTVRVRVIESYWLEWNEEKARLEWYEAAWTGAGFLPGREPKCVEYLDEKGATWCPMVAASCYVSGGSSESNARYGLIRALFGPQDEVNHGHSLAIYLMGTGKLLYEQGLVPEPNAIQQEWARGDGAVELPHNAIKDGRVQFIPNTDISAQQWQRIADAKAAIQEAGPRPMPMVPDSKMSGRLFIAQVESGAKEIKPVFNNLKEFRYAVFRRYWWAVRQYWTEPQWLRVRDEADDLGYRFVALNRPMTRGQRLTELLERNADLHDAARSVWGPAGDKILATARQIHETKMAITAQQTGQPPQMDPMAMQRAIVGEILASPAGQEAFKSNDVSALDVDIILDSSPNSAVIAHEQFQEIAGMVKSGMFAAMEPKKLLRLMVEMSGLHGKKRILDLIEDKPDPAAQQAQQQQMQLTLAQLQATVAKLQADAAKSQAQAQLAQQQAQGEPARTQLVQAQTGLAVAETQAIPHEANLKQAQAVKASVEAGRSSVPVVGG